MLEVCPENSCIYIFNNICGGEDGDNGVKHVVVTFGTCFKYASYYYYY
jgi:hypothetical protein